MTTATTSEEPLRPPVSVYLFLWGAWLLFRVGLALALLWGIRWQDGWFIVYPVRLVFAAILGYGVYGTWNMPPWRILLPKRWSHQ